MLVDERILPESQKVKGHCTNVAVEDFKIPKGEKPFAPQSYFALAMIFWYEQDIRVKYMEVWEALMQSWQDTFQFPLQGDNLKPPPSSGGNEFQDGELSWLRGTIILIFFIFSTRIICKDKSTIS